MKELTFTMHPLWYTAFCAAQTGKYATNGRRGVTLHRSRRKAMRMTGQGNHTVVSPKGRILARGSWGVLSEHGIHDPLTSHDGPWDWGEG